MRNSFKNVIVGARTAGISVAARLQYLSNEIAIIDLAEKHY